MQKQQNIETTPIAHTFPRNFTTPHHQTSEKRLQSNDKDSAGTTEATKQSDVAFAAQQKCSQHKWSATKDPQSLV